MLQVSDTLARGSAEILIHAFMTSRIDYYNVILSAVKKNTINRLQQLQNWAARLLTRTRKEEHIIPILKSLHPVNIGSILSFFY